MPGRSSCLMRPRLLLTILKHCTWLRWAAAQGSDSSARLSFQAGASWRQAAFSSRVRVAKSSGSSLALRKVGVEGAGGVAEAAASARGPEAAKAAPEALVAATFTPAGVELLSAPLITSAVMP